MNKIAFRNLPAFGLIASLIFTQGVSAAPMNNQQLTDEIASTQNSLNKIESDMKKLRRLLDNRALLELFQRMDELGEEVSNLRGMLEQQNHDLSSLKKRQRELYLDTDRRLRELEITSSRAPASVPVPVIPEVPVDTSPTVEPTTTPEIKTPETTQTETPQKPEVATPAVSVPVPAPVVAPTPVSKPATVSTSPKPPVSKEREDYQKAFDMLKEGRYKMATTSFKEFIQTYSDSSYAGNAQYWLGEANYVTRKFDQAVTEFRKVLQSYPGSNKVPDAMLKLGYTYYELRSNEQAKAVLEQLRKLHPKTTASRLAGKRLERMRKEGL